MESCFVNTAMLNQTVTLLVRKSDQEALYEIRHSAAKVHTPRSPYKRTTNSDNLRAIGATPWRCGVDSCVPVV